MIHPPRTLELWIVPLQVPPELLAELESLLPPEERARAARFKVEAPRRAFVVARTALRGILARWSGLPPNRVPIVIDPQGRPELGPDLGSSLSFNLSHAGEVALVAVRAGGAVGVDVEVVDSSRPLEALAERYFSRREREAMARLPVEERVAAFFQVWTRKEAFLKAVGTGLAGGLDAFDVSLGPKAEPEVLEVRGEGRSRKWWLWTPTVEPGYLAAVCGDGDRPPLPPPGRWRVDGERTMDPTHLGRPGEEARRG